MNVLEINGLTKHYGGIRALNNVSFSVPEGSAFGILGPNGSGKTTLLGLVTNVLLPTSGSFTLFEDNQTPDWKKRKQIGALLETPNFYHYLSAERNLQIAAEIKGADLAEIDGILKKVGLYERRQSKFSTFSLGMKQRLAIGSALLANPKVLILDEPTNGLDPEGIAEIRELIKDLNREGHTIIMASHLLDEVEKVCNHVAILKSGNLLTAGRADQILSNEDIVELGANDMTALHKLLLTLFPDNRIVKEEAHYSLFMQSGSSQLETINRQCFEKGIVLNRLLLRKKSLESMFLEVISTPNNK